MLQVLLWNMISDADHMIVARANTVLMRLPSSLTPEIGAYLVFLVLSGIDGAENRLVVVLGL